MTTKYHISKNETVVVCRAVVQPCPLGGGHFDTKEAGEDYLQEKYSAMDTYETHVEYGTEYKTIDAIKRGKFVEKEVNQASKDGKSSKDIYFDSNTKEWTKERQKLHDEIIAELHKKYENVPNDRRAIFSAGLPGAGKTTVLTNYENFDMDNWATISSDDIKEMLAERGGVPEIEGLTPMESSTLVHKESSDLSNRLLNELSSQGKNIIYDFTCKNVRRTKDRIDKLVENGYETKNMQFVFVEISPQIAKERAKFRYARGLNEGLRVEKENLDKDKDKKPVIGGRYLPEYAIDDLKPKTDKYSSVNAETLIQLHEDADLGLPEPKVYNNSGSAPTPVNYNDFNKESSSRFENKSKPGLPRLPD